jgi:hypothetical protein
MSRAPFLFFSSIIFSMSAPESLWLRLGASLYCVECHVAEVLPSLQRWSEPLQVPAAARERHTRVTLWAKPGARPQLQVDGVFCRSFDSPADLLPGLELLLYQGLSGSNVFHAAVLARGGRAYLFQGESGAGKSVLALDLVARGWTYLSDEFGPLTPNGEVLAVPRPVTFAVDELPPLLRERLTFGRSHWTNAFMTVEGQAATSLYVLPEKRAPSGSAWPVGGIFQLQSRAGRRPKLSRMGGPEMRARIFLLTRGSTSRAG